MAILIKYSEVKPIVYVENNGSMSPLLFSEGMLISSLKREDIIHYRCVECVSSFKISVKKLLKGNTIVFR